MNNSLKYINNIIKKIYFLEFIIKIKKKGISLNSLNDNNNINNQIIIIENKDFLTQIIKKIN